MRSGGESAHERGRVNEARGERSERTLPTSRGSAVQRRARHRGRECLQRDGAVHLCRARKEQRKERNEHEEKSKQRKFNERRTCLATLCVRHGAHGVANFRPPLRMYSNVKYVRGSESNCEHDSRKM